MRIAVCTPMFRPDLNGLVTAVFERCKELINLGHKVLLIAPTDGSDGSIRCISELRSIGVSIETYVSFYDKKNGINRPRPYSLRKIAHRKVHEFEPDILFVDSPLIAFIFARYMPRIKKLRKKGVLIAGICHANVVLGLKKAKFPLIAILANILGKFVYNRYDFTIMPSTFLKDTVGNVKNALVIPFLGYRNLSIISKAQKRKATFRVLYVGRIEIEKNIEFLYKVANNVQNKSKYEIEWIFVGGGGALENWRAKQTDRIKFIGPESPENVREWYKSSDIFVTACEHESFGLTIIEAMASGIPVLVPNAGMAPKHIPPSCKELIYNPSDIVGLTELILRLCTDQNFYNYVSGHRSMLELSWNEATNILISEVIRNGSNRRKKFN